MSKPDIIIEIDKLLGTDLQLAPIREVPEKDLLSGLMPYKRNTPKYAMDGDKLVGLNLADTSLTAEKWEAITKLPAFKSWDLQGLNVSDNQIKEFRLPEGMTNLRLLNVDDNPLTFPAEEIVKQGNEAILRFLKEILTQGERDVYEVKMLIVGEGETGKTTFWHKLQDMDYPVPLPSTQQPSTVGIEIKEGWEFEHLDRPGMSFLANLWDFGGQPIQHMTHQFFLTRRSFYVLMADGRRNIANFSYWFKIINLLGYDPKQEQPMPVLVILNKKGSPNASFPYDPEDVRSNYPDLKLIKYEVDFAVKDYQLTNLPKAIQEILCRQITHLPLKIPKLWDDVRGELYRRRDTEDHINLDTFKAICIDKGIEDLQQMHDLSQLLNDLGVILHHQDDLRLRDFIILNPQWAINAVYEILKHDEVGKNQGRFNEKLLANVWDTCGFSPYEQTHLMSLMLKDSFEVCFKAEEKGKTIYIAPQLLPPNRPEEFEWQAEAKALRYTYQYPFMPKGLIGRLIVRLNEHLVSVQNKKVIWVKGMLVAQRKCKALVIETEDKTTGGKIIKIEVQGPEPEERRFLLRMIRAELDKIHKRSFPALRYEELVPCCCEECLQSEEPNSYKLSDLERRKKKGKMKFECSKSFEEVKVEELLDGTFGEEKTRFLLHPIKEKIIEGELFEAVDMLIVQLPREKENIALMLKMRLNKYFEGKNMDILNQDEQKEWNKIAADALELCNHLENAS